MRPSLSITGAIVLLDSDPCDGDDNVHALLLGRLPLVAVCAVLLVVPEGADSAVHAATAVLLGFRGRANVLDYGAVGNVLVRGLRRRVGRGFGRASFLDEGLEDVLLERESVAADVRIIADKRNAQLL